MSTNNKIITGSAILLLLLLLSKQRHEDIGSRKEERTFFISLDSRDGLIVAQVDGSKSDAQEITDALIEKAQSWMSVRGPGRPQNFLVWSIVGPKKDMTDYLEHAQVVVEYAGSPDVGQVGGGKG